ncbi:MAG: nucleoside triphosphate pyrophosphohydrolase [Tissierellia bacterium]|nr:nucleoside triphosphate pyrophosphohydrolase [Tissierellia bacterium]
MNTIQIIGLGTGSIEDLTVKAYKALTDNTPTFLRTDRQKIVNELRNLHLHIESFDEYFEKYESFDEVYEKITDKLIELSKEHGKINYCTPGSPYYGDIVTKKLLNEYKDKINIIIIDGTSFLDKCLKLSGYGDYKNISILDCLQVDEFTFDINSFNIITQVYSRDIASELKIKLMEVYPTTVNALVVDVLEGSVKETPIFMIDQEKNHGFSTYICILPIEITENKVYNVNNLLRTVKILRGPEGCPWDKKQTHHSIRQHVIEEAYEVVDAIDNGNIDNLVEELGDLLFQVVFHAELGSEVGYFNFSDIVTNICKKMFFRHPHVFGDVEAKDTREALDSWEASKLKEKNLATYTENLKNVPKALSPLSRSYKIQKRAADVGFDWPNSEGALLKVKEELLEFIEEYNRHNIENMEEEFGDLLFALVNFARFEKINPDIALNKTINKFIERFEYIEKNSRKDLKEMTLKEMDKLWEESKFQ